MGRLSELQAELSKERMSRPSDPETEEKFPFLWELLTQTAWDDGSQRIPSSIKVDRVSGGYAVSLVDDSLWVKKSVMVLTLSEALGALEAALSDESVPWMHHKSYRNKEGPKVDMDGSSRKKKKKR